MEQVLQTRKWGNSGGVLLPKEWIGKQVKVILIDRTEEIKKEVFDILSPYLADIQGIYLVGSFARNEHEDDSDIDIIAISNNTKITISSGKYNIQIYTLQGVKNTLQNYPISIYSSLLEAKVIMNSLLLEELKKIKITLNSFAFYLEECKRVLNINKKIIDFESKNGNYLKSTKVIYSSLLRLRGLYIMNAILEKSAHSKKKFYEWAIKNTNLSKESWEIALTIYNAVRDNKKVKAKYLIEDALKILDLFKKELKKYDEAQKKIAKRN